MTLQDALHILARVHTRHDDVTGFVVDVGAHPERNYAATTAEWIEAWGVVRKEVHLETEPTAVAAARK